VTKGPAEGNFALQLAEDTVNSLITGPVLSINKLVTPAWLRRVTIDEPMEFQIGIGNTTAAGDIIDNQPRAGADYVPTSGDPPGVTRYVDVPNRIISWTVSAWQGASALTVTDRFKKNFELTGCDAIANINYQATSSEFPLNYTGLQYREPENARAGAVGSQQHLHGLVSRIRQCGAAAGSVHQSVAIGSALSDRIGATLWLRNRSAQPQPQRHGL
jgi:hypothetical protein